jgi:diaminopimelate decarboxylase
MDFLSKICKMLDERVAQTTMKSKNISSRPRNLRQAADPTEYTPHYAYRSQHGRASNEAHLYCEGVSLGKIAEAAGTPSYVYSRASIEGAYRELDRSLGSLPHMLCYSVKANSNLSVLRLLERLGSGFDIVSGGELDRLRRISVGGERIVFSGVGKTRDEIRAALGYPGRATRRNGILLFNVESGAELEVLLAEAARHVKSGGARPAVGMRINPDVLAGGHRHISTGASQHKFGVEWDEARRLYLHHKQSPWITWHGISAHIGSQILTAAPFRDALDRLASCVRELARDGIHLRSIDMGGGLGIRYTNEAVLDPRVYGRALIGIVRSLGCRLLLEPGRAIVGPAGVLLARVLYVKESRGKTFIIVDAAMNDLIRPALYDATHAITKVVRKSRSAETQRADVVGPVCETGDFLARDWPIGNVESGDILAVWTVGAYGFVQSSNYNSRPRAAEVLVEGQHFRIVRRREEYTDVVRGES